MLVTRIVFLFLITFFITSAVAEDGGKTWATAVATRPSDNHKIVYRYVQEYQPSFDRKKYSTKVTLSWRYESPTGMPSIQEREAMDRFEDLLEPLLDPTLLASLALVRTGDNLRQWTYYTKSKGEFQAKFDQASHNHGGSPIDMSITQEPAWDTYEEFIRGIRR